MESKGMVIPLTIYVCNYYIILQFEQAFNLIEKRVLNCAEGSKFSVVI
jgi:hypothetical protein